MADWAWAWAVSPAEDDWLASMLAVSRLIRLLDGRPFGSGVRPGPVGLFGSGVRPFGSGVRAAGPRPFLEPTGLARTIVGPGIDQTSTP